MRGKKKALGSSSRKQEKKGGDNMHRGAGNKGQQFVDDTRKIVPSIMMFVPVIQLVNRSFISE